MLNFEFDDFVENVVKKPELVEPFREHRQIYELNQGLNSRENFNISEPAVKSVKRKFKNLIKLDTEIEIKLKKAVTESADEDNIERGFDLDRGMHYYKVFFNEEE